MRMGNGVLNLLRSFTPGVLVVHAAAPDEDTTNKKEVDSVTKTIDATDVVLTVSGLYTTGGKGMHVGVYPVDLHYDKMKITTTIGGKEVDIKNLFEVEIEVVNGTTTKTISVTDAGIKDTTRIAKLTVKPRPVTLTSGDNRKTYDGTPVTNSNVTVSGMGFTAGEGATYNVTGSRTEVGGPTSNEFTYTLQANTLAKDYTITPVFGQLWIDPVGGNDTPPDDPSDPPSDPTPTTPAATPPVPAVLGAQRPVNGDAPAVLGARRGRTDDATNTLGRIVTIVVAAGIGFTMIFMKRKKEDENK
jgi:hypothetical protein